MMYATVAEFLLKHDPVDIGRKADDTGGEEAVETTVTLFLQDASSFIDTFLQARYTVPVVPVPATSSIPELRRACIIIAYHDMKYRRPGADTTEKDTLYDSIVAWLKMVHDGKADLQGAIVKSTSAAVFESNAPVFDPDNFESY